VEDTGPGIPRTALEKIFDPFYRVPGTKARGTGIGLATVKRVVEQHAGRIAVESTVGRGTHFQIWLPLASADRVSPPQPESRPPAAAHH
jgi:signal transduction histidine kinase